MNQALPCVSLFPSLPRLGRGLALPAKIGSWNVRRRFTRTYLKLRAVSMNRMSIQSPLKEHWNQVIILYREMYLRSLSAACYSFCRCLKMIQGFILKIHLNLKAMCCWRCRCWKSLVCKSALRMKIHCILKAISIIMPMILLWKVTFHNLLSLR